MQDKAGEGGSGEAGGGRTSHPPNGTLILNNNNNNDEPKCADAGSSCDTEQEGGALKIVVDSTPSDATSSQLWIGAEGEPVLARLQIDSRQYAVSKGRVLVGRESTSQQPDIVIPDNNYVSRGHLLLQRHDDNAWYLSCNGKNGVFLNNQLVKKGVDPVRMPLL